MLSRRLLPCFAFVIFLFLPAAAQTPEDTPSAGEQEKQQKAAELKKEVERKTLVLLDEVIGSVATLKLPENRALVQSSAADLLWERDEKRARALFRESLDNLKEAMPKSPAPQSKEQTRASQMILQQRKEVLQIITRRDPDYALELLRATRPFFPPAGTIVSGVADEELRLEQSLAIQIAANDPKRALEMAKESLSRGFSFELLSLLARLNEKDKQAASQLANDIIGKLQSENLKTNQEAAWLAVVLLRTGVQTEDREAAFALSSSVGGAKPYVLEETQLRDLLELVTTAALADTPNPMFSFLSPLMPEIEKRLPQRAAALRRRFADSNRKLDPQSRILADYDELIRRGTLDALLEAAAKATGEARELLYEQAVWKAMYRGGDAERARQLINEHIRDSAKRERMLQDLERSLLWSELRKEKLDEARRMLARIKSKEERAVMLAQIAFAAATRKDKKLAAELLDEALPLISLKPKNDQQFYILLQVMRAYALTEPSRAFGMIEDLIGQANELLSAASVLNGFLLPSGVFKRGEMVLPPGYSNVSTRFRDFGKELGLLAYLNFDRAKSDADKFQRNEARIMARLFIAQAVLSERLGSGVALNEPGVIIGY